MFQIDFQKPMSIYFVGIGWISMSGLAEILHTAGFRVSGSDWKESPITQGLIAKGITVKYGESASHVTPDIDCAVLTSAVKETNREFMAIRELGIPYLTRAQLLGQLMRNYRCSIAVSGTHGKTTTSSMISEILLEAETDPTLSIGGIYKPIGGNIRVGGKDYFLTEACEYTNSFLSFYPNIGVILNIEEETKLWMQMLRLSRKYRKNIVCPVCESKKIFKFRLDSDWASGSGDYYTVNPDENYTEEELKYDSFDRPDIEVYHCGDCGNIFE